MHLKFYLSNPLQISETLEVQKQYMYHFFKIKTDKSRLDKFEGVKSMYCQICPVIL